MSIAADRLALALVLGAAVSACGGGASSAPASSPSAATAASKPSAQAEKPAEDGAAQKTAALEKLTSDEATKDACDPDHKAALEKLLADVEAVLPARTGDDGKPLGLQIVGKRILPLSQGARSIEMTASGRGTELHVLVYGARDVSLDVLQGTTAATTLRSPFQRNPTPKPLQIELPKIGVVPLESDSRQVHMKPGQPVQVKLIGQGCALLVSFLQP